jgi:hypothetical protein
LCQCCKGRIKASRGHSQPAQSRELAACLLRGALAALSFLMLFTAA